MSTPRRFGSGASAMSWLTGKTPETKKSGAQLDREIAASLAKRAAPKRTTRGGTKTLAQFLDSLPPPLTRRGAGSSSVSAVAKRIRSELAEAVAAGVLPAGTKLSVRSDHNSIHADVAAWRGPVFVDRYTEHLMDPSVNWAPEHSYERTDPRLAPALNQALAAMTKIADRHNYHNSDLMTDLFDEGYYLTVSARPVEGVAETGIHAESNKGFAKLLSDGQDAAKALGPAATKSICGTADLSRASEYCLKRLIKVAERAGGRPVAYDKQRRGWFPT